MVASSTGSITLAGGGELGVGQKWLTDLGTSGFFLHGTWLFAVFLRGIKLYPAI